MLQSVKRIISLVRTGLTRMIHHTGSLFRLGQEQITTLIKRVSERNEEQPHTDTHSEDQKDEALQESDDIDTSFLEEPTQQKRSFSTFESEFESFDEFNEHQETAHENDPIESKSSDAPAASHTAHTPSDEKVDTFVQSMLETEDDAVAHTHSGQNTEEQSLEDQNARLSQSTYETEQSNVGQEEPDSHVQSSKDHTTQEMETDHLRKLEQKYLKMIVNDPKNVDSYRRLGNLYLAIENYTDARETFRHILRLKKDDQRAQEKLQEIERIVNQNQNL